MKHRMKKHHNRRLFAAAICLLPLILAACPQPQAVGKQAQVRKKEVYPYPHNSTVGSLGGIPIRFSSYITHGPVEYEDTPTAFSREWKTYKAPPRTLQSAIAAFGFDLNLETGKIFDLRKDSISSFYEEKGKPNTPWASVSFYGSKEPYLPEAFNRRLKERLEEKDLLSYAYRDTGTVEYGLEKYKPLAVRSSGSSDDLYIARDHQGNVRSYIECSNNKVPNPPCQHEFFQAGNPYIRFSLLYPRPRLQNWQKAEEQIKAILEEFADNAKHPERKL